MTLDSRSARGRAPAWVLILLGLAVLAVLATRMWPFASAAPAAHPSNSPRDARSAAAKERIDPAELSVRLGDLKSERPAMPRAERNPFRFQPTAPPPPPPGATKPAGVPVPSGPPVPAGPPAPPAIPLKFLGIVEGRGPGKVAAMTDCRNTYNGREGDIIDGRYRLLRIGVESIVIEYSNGTGRTTIRLSGDCPPR